MQNLFKRKTDWILGVLLIFVLGLPAIAQQTRTGIVRVADEQGKSEDIKLYAASYALIIGASNYTNGWRNLPGVKDDLIAVKAALSKQGFVVEELNDPLSDNLFSTINLFVNQYGLQSNNRLLIYFAGHGYTEKADDGRRFGYIVPVDAPNPGQNLLGFQQKAVTMDEIESVARKIRSRHALFVFDSCFSGTLLTKRGNTVPPIITLKATQPVRQFITSGAADQEVPDVSIFRRQFVEGIGGEADRNADGYVTVSELADYLQEKVTNYSRGSQTPLYGKILDSALDKGDFIFIVGDPSKKLVSKPSNSDITVIQKPEVPKKITPQPQTLSISEFTQTDICVEEGTRLSITAGGNISLGSNIQDTNAAGKDTFKTFLGLSVPIDKQYYIEQKYPLGALMCRFDYSNKWEYCSTSRSMTAEKKGCLAFEVNDNDKTDNRGAFSVTVKPL